MPMKSDRPGKAFEDEVAEILRMRGFSVEQDIRSDGFRADMIISKGQEPFREVYVVEAKDQERTIGTEDVLKLGGVVNAYQRTHPGIMALLVSRSGFTADAKTASASLQSTRLTTLDQLIDGLIDFSSYLRRYAAEYKESRMHKLFVDPAYSIGSVSAAEESDSLTSYLLKWVSSPSEPRNLLLLGEYGLGKTVTVENFCYKLATEINSGVNHLPVPVIIYLKNFTKALHDLRYLITSHLVNELNTEGRYAAFLRLLKRGRIVLILDGFDEMAMVVDEATRDRNFLLLQTLCSENARVIITGRPEYFPTEQHLATLISEERHFSPVVQSLLGDRQELPRFLKIHVAPFNQQRIASLLELYGSVTDKSDNYDAAAIARKIRETYDLKSLASRPVLLDLIVKTLPKMEDHNKPITAARLYDLYTRFWLQREEEKGRQLIPRDVKAAFVHELAWKIITTGKYAIHYQELPYQILEFFDPKTGTDWEAYDHDIRACSYLHRDDAGNFSFAHKTFMEFFCASRIRLEIMHGGSVPLAEVKIPSEVMSFLAELSDTKLVQALADTVYTYGTQSVFRENILRYLSRIPLSLGFPCYAQCLAFFPAKETNALDRLIRQRIDRLNQAEEEELIIQMLDLQSSPTSHEAQKAINRLLTLLDVNNFIVSEYADFLATGIPRFHVRSETIERMHRIRQAIEQLGGFARFSGVLGKPNILASEETLEKWSKKTHASPRLSKEIMLKFDLSPEGCLKLLEGLRFRSSSARKAEEVVRTRDAEMLAREILMSPSSAAEILLKSRKDRGEIRAMFQAQTPRTQVYHVGMLQKHVGLDDEAFRRSYPLLIAAAKRAGLLSSSGEAEPDD